MCINDCSKHGLCFEGNCRCYPGYYGIDCSLSYYAELFENPCDSYTCNGNGYCRLNSAGRNSLCVCYKGWTGVNCSKAIDHCSLQGIPCYNGCCIQNSTYCACDDGYEGKQCDIVRSYCRSSGPCKLGEHCDYVSGSKKYSCQCFVQEKKGTSSCGRYISMNKKGGCDGLHRRDL